MTQEQKAKIQSALVTLLLMLSLLCVSMYMYIYAVPEEEDEGIEISFGDGDTGGGLPDGQVVSAAQPQPTSAPPVVSSPSNNDLMTQEDESDAQLRLEQEKKRRERQEALAEQRRREAEQQAREQAEREARERALAEQQAREQKARDNAAQMGALFGQTESSEGTNGTNSQSASSATKGNPVGHGNSGGNSWSLAGRGLRGELPKPSTNFKQEGTVIVQIMVDKDGKVIQARASGGTVSDESTRQLAVRAAQKATFTSTDRPDKQVGTITYTFKLK